MHTPQLITDRHFQSPWFEVLLSGKARTMVQSCFLLDQETHPGLVLADYAGNVWMVDVGSGKKRWQTKIKNSLDFGFHPIENQLFAFHQKGLAAVDAQTGKIETVMDLKNVHSPILHGKKFYLMESPGSWISKETVVEIDPLARTKKTIYQSTVQRCLGGVDHRSITPHGPDALLFFSDGTIHHCQLPGHQLTPFVADPDYAGVGGILGALGQVFYIAGFDWERNAPLRQHPHFQRLMHSNGQTQQVAVPGEEFLGTLTYTGTVDTLPSGTTIVVFAGVVFKVWGHEYQKIGSLLPNEPYPSLPQQSQSARIGEQLFLFSGMTFQDDGSEYGFALFTVDDAHGVQERGQFICGPLGKNFKTPACHAFGAHVVVCGDGYYHLLRLP